MRTALEKCLVQIRFVRAVELARSCRYLEAEGVLTANGRMSSDPKELDLLARISAQQREYCRARRRWEAALQQSPGNADYQRALECAKLEELFQEGLRRALRVAFWAVTAAVLIFAFSSFMESRLSKRTPQYRAKEIQEQSRKPENQ